MKVEVTIRCAKCDSVEKVITELWSRLATSCGCLGPYRVLARKQLAEEEPPKANGKSKEPGTQKDASN